MVVTAKPQPPSIRIPLRNQGIFITRLEARPKSASREYALGSMTNIARTPTYPREATRETSFHGLAAPHFSGAFELLGHASRSMLKMPALKEMNRHMWGVGEAHTPHMSASFLAAALFSSLPGPRAAPGRRRRQEGGFRGLSFPCLGI